MQISEMSASLAGLDLANLGEFGAMSDSSKPGNPMQQSMPSAAGGAQTQEMGNTTKFLILGAAAAFLFVVWRMFKSPVSVTRLQPVMGLPAKRKTRRKGGKRKNKRA